MKPLLLTALAFTFLTLTAQAQSTPKGDFAVGYSFLHLNGSSGSSGASLNGLSGSFAYNTNDWLGIVGDFGVYHGSPSGTSLTEESYTFGPRVSIRDNDKIVPFVQALFGGGHISASVGGFSGSSNPFLFGFGGGADIVFTHSGKAAFRPQLDYIGQRANGSTENSIRLSFSMVYYFGK